MIPALLILGIGRQRRFPIPLPLFLIWPFVIVALGIVSIGAAVFGRRTEQGRHLHLARIGLLTLFQLSGLKIDVREQSGEGVNIWFL
jgi:hypothetical protein